MNTDNNLPDRDIHFSQEQLDSIKAQLLESIYADIGKSVVKKVLWILGSVLGALYLLLSHSDIVANIIKLSTKQ